MNHVVLMSYLAKSFSRRGIPTSPAYIPWKPLSEGLRSKRQRHTLDTSVGEFSAPSDPILGSVGSELDIAVKSKYYGVPSRGSVGIHSEANQNLPWHLRWYFDNCGKTDRRGDNDAFPIIYSRKEGTEDSR